MTYQGDRTLHEWQPPELRRLGAHVAPLSFGQERLWFIDATVPGSATYNVPLFIRWNEALDVVALRAALRAVVARHEVLRTSYEVRNGQRLQVVADFVPIDVAVVDLVGFPDALSRSREDAMRCAKAPFDLAVAPPMRCMVWQGIPGGDAMLLSIHHIAIDGWSLAVLFEDLALAYDAALVGGTARLAELPVQYADFAVWERTMFTDPALRRQLADRADELVRIPWDLTLVGARSSSFLPDGARSGDQDRFSVPKMVASAMGELARTLRATPFVVFFAAFAELLRRWSGRQEFLVGTVAANRGHAALEGLVGFFANTIPLRCHIEEQWSFIELCGRVRTEAFHSLIHQRIPFDQLTAKAAASRPAGHGSLVDIGFVLQNMPTPHFSTPPRWEPPDLLPTGTAKFDVLLILDDTPEGLVGTVEYGTDRYSPGLGRRLGEDYLALLAAVIANPDRPLGRLPIASAAHPGLPTEQKANTPHHDNTVDPLDELTDDYRRAAELFAMALSEVDRGLAVTQANRLGPQANFFALGGHSLLAVMMLAEAHKRHGVAVRPRDFLGEPTVAGLGRLLARARSAPEARPDATSTDRYPATSTQQRFWLLDRISALRSAYLVPAVVEFVGVVDPDLLRHAVNRVLAHHPALRSRFELDRKRRRVCYRTDGPAASATVTDARGWDTDKLTDHVSTVCWTPFDLAVEAPVRVEIISRSDRTLLVLCAHHIVTDGWSQQVLMDQIGHEYRARLARSHADLAPPVHPATLIVPPADALEKRIAQVVSGLRGAPTDVRLPHDRPRGQVQSTVAATCTTALGIPLTARVRSVAGETECTTFMVTAALLAVGIARTTGQRDFVFVFPWAGRETPESARAVGMFVNTLTLRVDLHGKPSWRELLSRVREASSASYRNADVPFDAVAAAVHPDRDLSRPAITPVYLAASDGEPTPPELGPAVAARFLPLDPLHVKYELELTVTDSAKDMVLTASYSTELFDEATVFNLLATIVAGATDMAANLNVPTDEEFVS